MPRKNAELHDVLLKLLTYNPTDDAERKKIITALSELVKIDLHAPASSSKESGKIQFKRAVLKHQEILSGDAMKFQGENPALTGADSFLDEDNPHINMFDLQSQAALALVHFSLQDLNETELDSIIDAGDNTVLRGLIGDNAKLGQLKLNSFDYHAEYPLLTDDDLNDLHIQAQTLRVQSTYDETNAKFQTISDAASALKSEVAKIAAVTFARRSQAEKLAIIQEANLQLSKIISEDQALDEYWQAEQIDKLLKRCPDLEEKLKVDYDDASQLKQSSQQSVQNIAAILTTLVTTTASTASAIPPSAAGATRTPEETAALKLKAREDDLALVIKTIELLKQKDPALTEAGTTPLTTQQKTIEENILLLRINHYIAKAEAVSKDLSDIEQKIRKNTPPLSEAQKRSERKNAIAAFDAIERLKNEIHALLEAEKKKTPCPTELIRNTTTLFDNSKSVVSRAKGRIDAINRLFPAEIFLQTARTQGLMADFKADAVVPISDLISDPTDSEKAAADTRAANLLALHGGQEISSPSLIRGDLLERSQIIRSTAVFGTKKQGTIELQVLADSSSKHKNRAQVVDKTNYTENLLSDDHKNLMALKMAEMLLNHYNPTAGPIVIGGGDKAQVRRLHAALLVLRPHDKVKISNSNEDGPEKASLLERQSTKDTAFIHDQFSDSFLEKVLKTDMRDHLKQTMETIEEEIDDDKSSYSAGNTH